jgi:hypothetical protein
MSTPEEEYLDLISERMLAEWRRIKAVKQAVEKIKQDVRDLSDGYRSVEMNLDAQ